MSLEEIKSEFESFLKTLIESYQKSTETIFENHSKLSDVGAISRDFDTKSKDKIEELATKNSISSTILNIELAELKVEYHGNLMNGRI